MPPLVRKDGSGTSGGELTTGAQTIAGAKTFNDIMAFKAVGGTISAGSYTTAGAWTFGPASVSNTHIFNGRYLRLKSYGTTAETLLILSTSDFSKNSAIGQENSIGNQVITGAQAYGLSLQSESGLNFSGGGSILHGKVTSAGAWTLPLIHNLGAGNITSGTYTPTPTNGINVSASTAGVSSYSRVGDIVTVTGSIDVTCTSAANTASLIEVTLPIASNFTLSSDLRGVGSRDAPSGTAYSPAYMSANIANDRAYINFNATVAANSTLTYTFQYLVK